MHQPHHIHVGALIVSGVVTFSGTGCSCSKTVERPKTPRVEQAELEKKPDDQASESKPTVPPPKTSEEADATNAAPAKQAPEASPSRGRESEPLATKSKQVGGNELPSGSGSDQPVKAAEKARQLLTKSRAAGAKGDSETALQQGLAAYDQVARHRGDVECDELATELLKWLEEIGESGASRASPMPNRKRLKID